MMGTRWTTRIRLGVTAALLALVGSTLPAQSAARCTAAGLCPVPASIDATGSRDVAAELTDWLSSVPAGFTADLGTGTYLAQTTIRPTLAERVTIRGGTLLRTAQTVVWPTPNPHLWLADSVGTRVVGLRVRGTNTVADQRAGFGSYLRDYEFEAAIRAERFTNLAVTGLDVDAVWGDGVQLQTGTGATVTDSTIDRVGRQGVTVIASGVTVRNVKVLHGRRSGFDLEPDTSGQVVRGIEISGSHTNTIGLAFASAGRGRVDDVWLHDNTSAGPSVPVVYVKASDGSRRANWTVERHTALNYLGSPQAAVLFVNVDNATVRDSVLPLATTQSQVGVKFSGCGGVLTARGNDFRPGAGYLVNENPMPGTVTDFGG